MYQAVAVDFLRDVHTEEDGAKDMANEARVRAVVERYSEFVGADVERAEELYHADAVLESRRPASGSSAGTRSPSGGASTR